MKINKMIHITDCTDHNVIEIKNHLIDLYQRVGVTLLKKHVKFQEKLSNANNEWQETCDQLITETQTLKDERDRTDAENQALVTKLTN